ncbi:MAG: polysaccharide biosynthesis tyrosine autokinase [Candidatus Hydrogenedentota bacterium]|nr:MAG: polysaccharide biosynthesis tyrosine autokinase [Candidatus Hydrogenedentota bacterium]
MAVGYEMSIQDYLRVIFKRKWIILLSAFTLLISAIVYTNQFLTPIYRTSARVELNYQSTLANLLADALLYKGNELATAIEFATSMPVMERAAMELGWVGVDSSPAEVTQAASTLKAGASANGDGQTNFITIYYTGDDPHLCARAANAIAKAFEEEYSTRNKKETREIRHFLEMQLRDAEEKLYEAENALLRLKQEKPLVTLEPGVKVSVDKAADLEAEYQKVQIERMRAERELAEFKKQLDQEKEGKQAEKLLQQDPRFQRIKQELFDAEVELARKLKDLTPRHPEVEALERKITRLRSAMEMAISEIFTNRRGTLEARVMTLRAREKALANALPQINALLEQIPRNQIEQARLSRKVALQEKLYNFFRDKLEEKRYEELISKGNTVSFVEPAPIPAEPIYPNKTNNAIIGLVIGLMLGFALAFVVEAMDTSIGTIGDVERTTGLAVLGVIPSIVVDEEEAEETAKAVVTFDPDRVRARDLKERLHELDQAMDKPENLLGFKPHLITYFDPKSPISEAYRTLRTNVQFRGVIDNAKTLTVTSSGPQEGKTTTLCNLAVTMAQSGQKVLAVGCNLRRPALHKLFGIPKKPGMTDVLIGAKKWQEVVKETGIENLHAFCSGPIPPNPSELIASEAMTEMIREVREEYDVIVFDCPPVLPVTDAAVLSSKVDSVLLVYHVGKAAREALLRAKVQLENVGARLLGIVLNRIPAEGRLGYSYYYYHYHYYGDPTSEIETNGKVLRRRKT